MLVTQPKFRKPYWLMLAVLLTANVSYAQTNASDSVLQSATLEKVVEYALVHQPAVQQAIIDQEITNRIIRGKLADWYPQINASFFYQRTFDINSTVFEGVARQLGTHYNSNAQLNATQTLFNRDVLLAVNTASKVRTQARQTTSRSKIDVVVSVTKAFYDVLATSQQIKVSQESIVRLERSLKDAYSRYTTGIADKTDYKRATILLGNAKASLKSNREMFGYKQEYLKTVMGYPAGAELPIQYDTLQMENEISVDTLEQLSYNKHIDYQILATQRELQDANLKYSYWGFLPSLNANAAYVLNYQNNNVGNLYDQRFTNSFVGATFLLPIFQGGKRIAKIQEQKWTRKRLDWSLVNLENSLSTEYTRALASYKSNLANYNAQKENVTLAQEVYDIINLQYRNGVKAYLDVTVAETDLRTTRINYFNALYSVLASKMDVQRALGQINY